MQEKKLFEYKILRMLLCYKKEKEKEEEEERRILMTVTINYL